MRVSQKLKESNHVGAPITRETAIALKQIGNMRAQYGNEKGAFLRQQSKAAE